MADTLHTITLQNIVNLASTFIELLPITGIGGFTNEPALSICNDVLAELLAAPYDWKWNRAEMPLFVTSTYKQDYLFAGACAFTLGSTAQGWAIDLTTNSGLTQAGGVVTVKTLETHQFAVGDVVYLTGCTLANGNPSAYNAVLTQTSSSSVWSAGRTITGVTATTFTFAGVTAETSGAAGISDFGWLCNGTQVAMLDTSPLREIRQIETVFELTLTSRSAVTAPEKVCVLQDLGTGVLKLRLREVPAQTPWGLNLVYQKRAPLKTDLTKLWDPIPDNFSYVYRQGFLSHAYRAVNSSRAEKEDLKFQRQIAKALSQGDNEADDIHVYPEAGLMTGFGSWSM